MRTIVFSSKSYDKEFLTEANSNAGHEMVFVDVPADPQTVVLARGFEAACVFVNDELNSKVLNALHQEGIKMIALRCAGFNNVDLKAAHQLGIKVARVPAYSPNAVAEHAVALILTLNRKTHKAYNRVREQNFSLERLTGFDLFKKTVGVVGTGKIGQAFCSIMLGFGCKVLAFDKYPSQKMKDLGVEYVEMDQLLEQSDIISLHCPLTPETHHMINADTLAKMKPNVMLINTSRGKLINTQEVYNALKKQKIGYLGIDVYESEENLFFSDLSEMVVRDRLIARLTTFPNVLITAHQAFFTQEALTEISQTTIANLTAFQNGEALVNEVTLDMIK